MRLINEGKMLKIVVCIKQVPDPGNVRMDEKTGTMVREGVESIINPLDLYAIEVALLLKEEHGGIVTVISMGPPGAEKAVREAMAMGCDEGGLISDRAFAGSDTHATSYALSKAIEKLAPYDLILCGERATDGDTSQVGPGIASFLGLPVSTYTSCITSVDKGRITVERLIETGYEKLRLPLPCLLTVVKEISYPRLPTLRGKHRSRRADVPVWGPGELQADKTLLGLAGSPTRVVKISKPRIIRKGRMVEGAHLQPQDAASQLVDFLEENNLL